MNKKTVMIIPPVMLAIAFIGNAYFLFQNIPDSRLGTILRQLSLVFNLFALVFASIYYFSGYQKSSSKYFKLFICGFMISALGTFANAMNRICANELTNQIGIVLLVIKACFDAIALILLCILLLKKDLGKTKSLTLTLWIFILYFSVFICGICKDDHLAFVRTIQHLAKVSLSLVLVVMMQLKYIDKSQRNTK